MPLTTQELDQIRHAVVGMTRQYNGTYLTDYKTFVTFLGAFCETDRLVVNDDGSITLKSRKEPAAPPPEEKPIKDSSPL